MNVVIVHSLATCTFDDVTVRGRHIKMVNFSRGGHEGDWVIHLLAGKAILPYFSSAGCHNYAMLCYNLITWKDSIRRC